MSEWHSSQRAHLFATWSAQDRARRFEIDDARGSSFHVPGRGWIYDLESQAYNVNVGHRHPTVLQHMEEALRAIPCAAPNVLLPVREALSRSLCELTGMGRVFLATGGAEAVENAVKMARLLTRRETVLTRRHSYHGATLGMLFLGGDDRRRSFFPHDPPHWIDDPYPAREPEPNRPSDWVDSFEATLARCGAETVAAVLLEGLTGTNGMQIPPADFWPHVRRRCDELGILLISDEIFSGLGRAGEMLACQAFGVKPDLVVLGKGLASGYAPISAVAIRESLARTFDQEVLWCGLTNYAHPVACAAAMGVLEVLEREQLVDHVRKAGPALGERLRRLPGAGDVRGRGFMWAVELSGPAQQVADAAFDAGAYVPYRGQTLFVAPPLCTTEGELEAAVGILEGVLDDLRGATGGSPS